MEEHQHLPNMDRLSVLTASILLAYAMLPFIQIPERSLVLSLLGVAFFFKVDFATLLAVICAGLAAAGTDWLLHDHPHLGSQRTFSHWMIPALTAWVIGVPLSSLKVGIQWWMVFGLGGLLLVLVLVSEYIAVDPSDSRHGPASVGLTAISYALLLMLTISLAAAGSRLYVLLPALTLAIFLVALRTLYLRSGKWFFGWAAAIALIAVQSATALHYWPVSPLRYGLMILGLAYSLTSLAGAVEEGRPGRRLWVEPAIMLAVLWGLAVALRG